MQQNIYLFSTSTHPDAISINSLDIVFFKPKIDFSNSNYLIITSKQAVKALKQYDKEAYINKPALCISQATAKSFEALGGTVLKTGEGYGDSLSQTIQEYPKSTKWLYLRAKEIASNFVQICLEDNYKIEEATLYESNCSTDIQNVNVEEDAILIFTSPSSVKCFSINNSILNTHKVIVIGKTTAKVLPKNIEYSLPQRPSIESCFKLF